MLPLFDSERVGAIGLNPMLPRVASIKERHTDTADTFILRLEAENGEPLPAFSPGQFNMVYVFGVGEVPLSIGGVPSRQLLHTARTVGTVTRGMSQLRPGDQVGIRGPFGSSWPLEEAVGKDVLIAAGGIGLAALHSTLCYIIERRQEYRDVSLFYGTRTPRDILYSRDMQRWAEHGVRVAITVDRASSEWRGSVGVVTKLIAGASLDPQNCVALICGPEIMMRFTILELRKRNVPERSIFISMERNMKCAIGFCGHCQFGPEFICKDGPVFRYECIRDWLKIREL